MTERDKRIEELHDLGVPYEEAMVRAAAEAGEEVGDVWAVQEDGTRKRVKGKLLSDMHTIIEGQ